MIMGKLVGGNQLTRRKDEIHKRIRERRQRERRENWDKYWDRKSNQNWLRHKKQINHDIRRIIADKMLNLGCKTAIDVGSATCIDYPLYKNRDIDYTGLDITRKFLARATKLYPDIKTIHGNILKNEINDGMFDGAYCKDLIEHIPPEYYKQAISQIWRMSKKVAMFGFFIPPTSKPDDFVFHKKGYWINHYNKEKLVKFMESLDGFDQLDILDNIGYNNSSLFIVTRGYDDK